MHRHLLQLLTVFLLLMLGLPPGNLAAQEVQLVSDTFCIEIDTVTADDLLIGNVLDNDIFFVMDDDFTVFAQIQSTCFRMDRETGNLFFTAPPGEECCGEYNIPYTLVEHNGCPDPDLCQGTITVIVKCPKPDCSFVDLSELDSGDPTAGDGSNGRACIQACENSVATYFTDYLPDHEYDWLVENGTPSYSPAPPAQVQVTWGPNGPPTSLTLLITPPTGPVDTVRYCVDLTVSPTADFDFDPVACAESPVCFENTSIGAVDYLWDFGDGNYATTEDACHAYGAGGTYTVTLYATSAGGTDAAGNELCCCTDSISMTVEIDPLPGPNIYWVSTLCEGDESVYWTDAEDCDTYLWEVRDADGNIMPFTFPGMEQDSIMVTWGAGPQGTISLMVTGCEEDYCPLGSEVIVPIISTNGDIDGPIVVCQNTPASYELPKWNGVTYQWTVTGGTIVGSDTSHTVNVIWGPAGTGTLSVEYGSDFLAGLPNHSGADCYGASDLEVQIQGDFRLNDFSGGQACITSSSFIGVNSDFGGATFTYDISPGPVGFTVFGSGISIDWASSPGPGLYTVTVTPDSPGPGDYCVPERMVTINVNETPAPDSILGPLEYCVGDTLVYSVENPVPGYQYNWFISGGTITSGFLTPNVVIVWNDATMGTLSVRAVSTSPVFCQSEPISISPQAINLLPLTGLDNLSACINQVQSYGILPSMQHPDTYYEWTITDPAVGTVIAGQGTEKVDIQWNNSLGTATIVVVATLCDQTESYTETLTLFIPEEPMIVQSNDMCPGVPADLSIDGTLFSDILWSTSETTDLITITTGGLYVVNTVDDNGCSGVDAIVPEELEGPATTITVNGPSRYCISNASDDPTGTTVDLLAASNPDYTFQWFCNGVLQAPTGPVFTHIVTDTVMNFDYYFVVTDTNTGCVDTSRTKRIRQLVCFGGTGACPPQDIRLTANAEVQSPICDQVTLSGTITAPVFAIAWTLPFGEGGVLISGDLNSPNAVVAFPNAECYTLRSRYFYETTTGDTCYQDQLHTVCIPISANIGWTDSCGTVSFEDLTTTLGTLPVDSVRWDFGDGGMSTLSDPVHTFTGPGPHTVVLTAYSDDCLSTDTLVFSPGPGMNPVIIVPAGPLCTGDAITFGATAPGAIIQRWDFGDGATFIGENPQHAYAAAMAYPVTLEVEDGFGCIETTSITITVSASPTPVEIDIDPGSVVCDGETVTLSVPGEAGVTHIWSNGDSGLSTDVTTSGMYTVTLSTADGCEYTADSVEITFLPLPPSTVSGSPFICSGDPATLSGPSGPYTYEWIDVNGDVFATTQTATFTLADLANNPYTLNVIEASGCTSSSDPVEIMSAISPTPEIELTVGTGCEGEANELSITAASFDPDLIYTWSNGMSGPTTIAAGAGTYTVIALDPTSGCTGRDSWVINPLPDVCIVPFGCYEACTPDTLCGPTGVDYTYVWYQDGTPVSTDRCYIASVTGTYNLEVTNEFGCTETTDSLYLELIDCDGGDCEGITTTITPQDDGECCYSFSYADVPMGTFGVHISSPDAGLLVDPGSIAADYIGYVEDANNFQLGSSTPLSEIPTSSGGSAMVFCLEDPTVNPQTIIIQYLDSDFMPFCSDTIQVDCETEPECVYVARDTITCTEDKLYQLTMTICRPLDADFEIGYVQLLPDSPAAEDDFMLGIDISPALSAMNPCTTITIVLTTMAEPGSDFCYSVVAHSDDPANNPAALCCSSEESYCLVLPDCDPCDDLGITSVEVTNEEECCYQVSVFNEVTDPVLDGISLCPLDPAADLSAFTTLGGPWIATASGSNTLDLTPTSGTLDIGDFALPEICLDGATELVTQIELKWMMGDSIVCRDTFELRCEPDCGYLLESSVICEGDNYIWTGTLVNASDYPISSAYFEFDAGAGLSPYNTNFDFGMAIPPGGSTTVNLVIGEPAGPGDEICVNVYLHEENDDETHLNCCVFKATLVMPDCEIGECFCDEDFVQEVIMGFTRVLSANNSQVTLNPIGDFTSCDSIAWDSRIIGPGEVRVPIGEGYNFTYDLPSPNRYSICMVVYRTDSDGETCDRRVCRTVDNRLTRPTVYPNPAAVSFRVSIDKPGSELEAESESELQFESELEKVEQSISFQLMDVRGRPVNNWNYTEKPAVEKAEYNFDISRLKPGIYLLKIVRGDEQWVEKIMVF